MTHPILAYLHARYVGGTTFSMIFLPLEGFSINSTLGCDGSNYNRGPRCSLPVAKPLRYSNHHYQAWRR